MKLGVIGVGQAGGRIADLLYYHSLWDHHGSIAPFCLAVNTAKADLMGPTTINKKDKILVGQTEVRGHGVGLRRTVGADAVQHGLHMIMHAITEKSALQVDGYLIIAALGGGTGSGGAPIIARVLKQVYSEPVYILGILPSEDEGDLMARNATHSLLECYQAADGVLLFDNNIWKNDTISINRSHEQMNHELVKPLVVLLGAGEVTKASRVGIKVVDASDIIATLSGIGFIGFSSMKVKSTSQKLLFFRQRKSSIDQLKPSLNCCTVIRDAATLRMSGQCNLGAAHKALVIISGDPSELSMEGFRDAKAWIQTSVGHGEVRGGDYPIPGASNLSGIVLASAPGLDGFPVWSQCLESHLRQYEVDIKNHKKNHNHAKVRQGVEQ
jgi:cell division GTPase FtsZ